VENRCRNREMKKQNKRKIRTKDNESAGKKKEQEAR